MSKFPQISDDSSLFGERSGRSSLGRDSSVHKVVSKAQQCLERAQSLGLSSRYLKPSEEGSLASVDSMARDAIDGSSIDLSELFPKECSTPRVTGFMEQSGRPSLADKFFQMSDYLGSKKMNLDEIGNRMSEISATRESLFTKDWTDVEKRFLSDELSWKNEFAIPTNSTEISACDYVNSNTNVSKFFEKGNPTLSSIFKKSPEPKKPVPLVSITQYDVGDSTMGNSLSVSKIMKALTDTELSPDKIVDHLLKKKSSPLKSPVRSPRGTSPPTRELSTFDHSTARKPLNFDRSPVKNPRSSSTITSSASPRSENKENLDKSVNSIRSSSSLSTLPGGKLPIECSRPEIIWCCTKVGRGDAQKFALRNKSASKLKIRLSVSNPAFKIKDHSNLDFAASSQVMVKFESFETRNFTVTFAPISHGSAIDVLDLKSTDPQHEQTNKQTIRLSGYGGFAKITLMDVPKDATGKYLISLGHVDNTAVLESTMRLKNVGDLPAFAYLKQNDHTLNLHSNLIIEPSMILLAPNQQVEVTVKYVLVRENMSRVKLKSSVFDAGKINIYHGSEVDRMRLKKMLVKCSEANAQVKLAEEICQRFPGENSSSINVNEFRESGSRLQSLLRQLSFHEVMVTFADDLDGTTICNLPDVTTLFESLCDVTVKPSQCYVEPQSIVLVPKIKTQDTVFILSKNTTKVYFQVFSEPDGLLVQPKDGEIAPGAVFPVVVKHTGSHNKTASNFNVRFLFNDDCVEISVKILQA